MDNIKIKRIIAYTVDIFIVSSIVVLLGMVDFLNPNREILQKKEEELVEYSEVLLNNTSNEILTKDYLDLAHDISYYSVVSSVVEVAAIILYFTLYPFFFNGQTIGKKLLKIKIVNKEEKKPSFWQLLLRSLLVPVTASILMYNTVAYILIIISTLAFKGMTYMYVYTTIYIIATVFCYIDIIKMISNQNNESLHDRITKTKVITC